MCGQGVIRFEAERSAKRSDIQPADLAETDLRLGRGGLEQLGMSPASSATNRMLCSG